MWPSPSTIPALLWGADARASTLGSTLLFPNCESGAGGIRVAMLSPNELRRVLVLGVGGVTTPMPLELLSSCNDADDVLGVRPKPGGRRAPAICLLRISCR